MLSKLISPYPAPRPDRTAVLSGLFMGLFVGLFLLYFLPFGLGKGPFAHATVRVAFFGLITLASFLVLEVLLPLLVPPWFKDQDWKVWHRIGYYLVLLWLIATLNGLYINYLSGMDFNWQNYGSIIGQTMALGMLPVTMIVMYRYNEKMVFYLKEAAEMERTSRLRIVSVPVPDTAQAPGDQDVFLAAEAFGNYVKVYYASDTGWRKEVQRLTLSKLVDEMAVVGVIRCHRSFAVSTEQVRHISGNAQGLQLQVGAGALEVPVSRSYIKLVRETLS
jgi:hypothetical protein